MLGVEPNEDASELIVSAELSHFSRVVVSTGFFDVVLQAPDVAVVDVPFTASARVMLTDRQNQLDMWYGVATITASGRWQIEGEFRGGPPLSPDQALDRPPLTSLNSGSTTTFSASQQFTCKRQGPFSISYAPKIQTETQFTRQFSPFDHGLFLDSSGQFVDDSAWLGDPSNAHAAS